MHRDGHHCHDSGINKTARNRNFILDSGYAANAEIISIRIRDTVTIITLRKKYPKNSIGNNVRIVLKIPRIRQVENTLGKHIKLLS